MLPVLVRPAVDSDLSLIGHTLKHIDKMFILNETTDVWVICDVMDSDVLYGFLWAPKSAFVAYIFIKEPFRRFGFAKELIKHVFKNRRFNKIPGIQINSMSRKSAIALKRLNIVLSPLAWAEITSSS